MKQARFSDPHDRMATTNNENRTSQTRQQVISPKATNHSVLWLLLSDKPPWLAATTNHENLNPANPAGL
jgi:hypothetical protein